MLLLMRRASRPRLHAAHVAIGERIGRFSISCNSLAKVVVWLSPGATLKWGETWPVAPTRRVTGPMLSTVWPGPRRVEARDAVLMVCG
jgi:hypothetical protein